MRTIISRLKEAGLVSTLKVGCAFTDEGLRLWNEYRSVFRKKVEIGKELTLANCNFAILAKTLDIRLNLVWNNVMPH
ncbi:MAG: hypothetical protein QMD23_04035 [Candidatus Bathyarchaeia archaeon]|nr:hypothetical protein [Candidatus Bathyarchaeia archaeon]